MGNAASHVQHLFYAGATDPRIFNTGMVTPRRMVQSQPHQQSGNRFPTAVTNQSEWSEAQVEGALDKADLVLLLASLFPSQRTSGGDFLFKAFAGAFPSGFDEPKEWEKLLSYNWRDSGPSYEAESAIMQSMEMSFNRKDTTMMTAAFAAKQYNQIARPATAPVPVAVNTQVVRNSDIRIGLSAGRLGELKYPTSVLRSRWTYSDLIELVFGANQADRGWTDFVEANIQPTLRVSFLANDEYLEYANADADTFVTLSDAAGTFEWTHLARFTDVPNGPAAMGNIQDVEISFLPYARVDGRRVDLELSFTAAEGTGTDANRWGVRAGTSAIGSSLMTTAGYRPAGLDTILYYESDDYIRLGTVNATNEDWPTNWEPESIAISTGAALPLAWHVASRQWRTEAIATNPFTATATTATIAWKWTPATYMSGFVNGTGVLAL